MGKKGALMKDNPIRRERDVTIAAERLRGKTYKELSQDFGISKTQVGRILNDAEIKEVIETTQRGMVNLVPKAIENYQTLLDSDDEKIKLTASKEILQTVGVMPSHTQSVLIQNVFNQTDSDVAQELTELAAFLKDRYAADLEPGEKD